MASPVDSRTATTILPGRKSTLWSAFGRAYTSEDAFVGGLLLAFGVAGIVLAVALSEVIQYCSVCGL